MTQWPRAAEQHLKITRNKTRHLIDCNVSCGSDNYSLNRMMTNWTFVNIWEINVDRWATDSRTRL
jgi:hypothetical protein